MTSFLTTFDTDISIRNIYYPDPVVIATERQRMHRTYDVHNLNSRVGVSVHSYTEDKRSST